MSIGDNGQTNKRKFVFTARTCAHVPVCECGVIGNRFGFPAMLSFQEAIPDGRLVGRTNVCVFVCATWGVRCPYFTFCVCDPILVSVFMYTVYCLWELRSTWRIISFMNYNSNL